MATPRRCLGLLVWGALAAAAVSIASGSSNGAIGADASSACAPPAVMTQSDKNSGAIDYVLHPRLRPAGHLRAVMLFVDFPDAPATESTTALYDALVPPAQAWFASASYGRTALDVTPIHTWFRMPRPSTTYVTRENPSFELHRELMQAAVTAADPSVDFAGYQLLYVVASWPSGIDFSPGFTPIRPEFGVTADGNTLANGVLFGGDARDATPDAAAATLVHETLHTFGLPDLWDFAQSFPASMDFVGGWSIMSSKLSFPGILAWERLQLGWLDDTQVACVTTAGRQDVRLDPLEGAGGAKAAIVKLAPTSFVVAEVRRQTAEDTLLCDSGVLVYTVEASREDGTGPIRAQPAQPDDGSQDVGACSLFYRAAYGLDGVREYSGFGGKLGIAILAQDGDSYLVRVSCTAPLCPEASPPPSSLADRRVTLTIVQRSGLARGTVSSSDTQCVVRVVLSIERRKSSRWATVRRASSGTTGAFRTRLPAARGLYRAFVPATDRCAAATSRPVRYRGRRSVRR